MTERSDANADPFTGEAGAHPVGVGVGTTAGSLVGAAVGAIAGPAGVAIGAALAGAVMGGVAGGLAGKSAAESIDPTVEDRYWSMNYGATAYVPTGANYRIYQPAYRYGWESYAEYRGHVFDEVEERLARDWEKRRAESSLSWENARLAVRDAWTRLEKAAAAAPVKGEFSP